MLGTGVGARNILMNKRQGLLSQITPSKGSDRTSTCNCYIVWQRLSAGYVQGPKKREKGIREGFLEEEKML